MIIKIILSKEKQNGKCSLTTLFRNGDIKKQALDCEVYKKN
jgi:hypothetical protein